MNHSINLMRKKRNVSKRNTTPINSNSLVLFYDRMVTNCLFYCHYCCFCHSCYFQQGHFQNDTFLILLYHNKNCKLFFMLSIYNSTFHCILLEKLLFSCEKYNLLRFPLAPISFVPVPLLECLAPYHRNNYHAPPISNV